MLVASLIAPSPTKSASERPLWKRCAEVEGDSANCCLPAGIDDDNLPQRMISFAQRVKEAGGRLSRTWLLGVLLQQNVRHFGPLNDPSLSSMKRSPSVCWSPSSVRSREKGNHLEFAGSQKQ